jgi:hypothetical protein
MHDVSESARRLLRRLQDLRDRAGWLELAGDGDGDQHEDGPRRPVLPQRFAGARLDGLPVGVVTAVELWLSDVAAGSGSCLVVLGPTGAGKTWVACAAATAFAERHGSHGVAFRNAVELLDDLRHAQAAGTHSAAWASALSARLLVLDDVGAVRPSEWTDERLYLLANHRWERALPTIVTTDVEPTEVLPPRVLSRLAGHRVTVSGEDRRQAALE